MAEPHRYLSTSCLHGVHLYCSSPEGSQGPKKPASCKFCSAPCVCECHQHKGPIYRLLVDGPARTAEEWTDERLSEDLAKQLDTPSETVIIQGSRPSSDGAHLHIDLTFVIPKVDS